MLTQFDRKISHIQTLQPKSGQITTEVGLEVWERPADCGRRGWTFPVQIHHASLVENPYGEWIKAGFRRKDDNPNKRPPQRQRMNPEIGFGLKLLLARVLRI